MYIYVYDDTHERYKTGCVRFPFCSYEKQISTLLYYALL